MDGILVQQMSSEMTGGRETWKVLKLPLWLSHGLWTPGNTYPTPGPFGWKFPAQRGKSCQMSATGRTSALGSRASPLFFPLLSVRLSPSASPWPWQQGGKFIVLRAWSRFSRVTVAHWLNWWNAACSEADLQSAKMLQPPEAKRWSRILNSSLSAHNTRPSNSCYFGEISSGFFKYKHGSSSYSVFFTSNAHKRTWCLTLFPENNLF